MCVFGLRSSICKIQKEIGKEMSYFYIFGEIKRYNEISSVKYLFGDFKIISKCFLSLFNL